MRKSFALLLLVSLTLSTSISFASDDVMERPFIVGVAPYLSARVLVTTYDPMRLHLEKSLGKPVKIYTAAGMKQFYLNAKRGDYDLVISTSNIARLLQKEEKLTPLLRYSGGGRGLIMTTPGSTIKSIQDLRGTVIALPDPLIVASIVVITSLKENGLKAGTDFTLLQVPTFASAILAVQKGEAAAAVSAPAALAQMPQEMRESVKPIFETDEFITLVFLAKPHLAKKLTNKITSSLLNFGSETEEGKQFLTQTGFGNIVPVTQKDMNSLDHYVPETKRILEKLAQ